MSKLPLNIEVLISEEEIKERIRILGQTITRDYAGQSLLVVGVLKGAFVFCSDLIREIDLPIKLDFISLSSYGDGTDSTGEVKKNLDLSISLEGENVLIVEDIVDTGLTMDTMIKDFKSRKPKSLKLATFLHKPARSKIEVQIDYLGFEIEDKFVIGYGLDYAQKFRELPYVGVLGQV